MNYRKFYQVSGIIIGTFTALWLIAVAIFFLTPEQPELVEQAETPEVQPVVTAPLDYYLVRSYRDTVAVYEVYTNGWQSLSHTLEIDLTQLRAQDKSAFDEGIILQDKQALASLIEDFTS